MASRRQYSSICLVFVAAVACGQSPLETEAYLKPPAEIEKLVMRPRWENVNLTNLSPDRTRFLVLDDDGMPPLAALGKQHKNLGGFQVDLKANRSRSSTIQGRTGIRIFDISGKRFTPVQIPKGAEVGSANWSPDGKYIAFIANFDNRSQLYVADAGTGKSRLLLKQPLLATMVTAADWSGDGTRIAAVIVPETRGPAPMAAEVAAEPKIRLSDAAKHKFRTYPSLLETPADQRMFEYYTTGQLVLVDPKSGKATPVGAPAMIQSVSLSPNAKYLRVRTVQKPFSYIVPTSSFGAKEEIWDLTGMPLAEIESRSLDLSVDPPARRDTTRAKRLLAWRPDGNGLSYIESEPRQRSESAPVGGVEDFDEQGGRGGRGAGAAPAGGKDRVMQWLPPFGKDDAKVVYSAEGPLSNVRYSEDCKTLFLSDTKGADSRTYAVFVDEPGKTYMIASAKTEEFYEAPGSLLTKQGSLGEPVVTVSSAGAVYLYGTKYSKDPKKEAPKPFLDRVETKSGAKTRLFESDPRQYETVTALLDDEAKEAVISRQSRYAVPNSYLLDLGTKSAKQLTANQDQTPEITACQRFVVDITRADGFKFQAKVTMPASWKHGERLPAMFWFYPSEFTDQAAYDRTLRAVNINAYPSTSAQSMAMLTQLGYAYVEPDLPITGPDGTMNNNYVPNLRNSLWAVIDTLDKQGFIDRDRLAIGGHSYGAFSTVNALVHTPFFKAGIAGSGAYNRTLTPLGFQSEQRLLWDARDMYLEVSPFMYADRLTGALLMTHGMEDQNIGTFPINSERLFQALSQLGKTCALYMYPYEDHGQVARETVLDKWARWVAWLDKYVKNAK